MKYYCIGIKGTGMSSLAQILYDLGNEVYGYDDVVNYKFTQKELDKRGIKIYHDNQMNLTKDMIVTYSVAVDSNHPEIKRAREMGLTIKKYNEIIGEITKMFDTICVSGTHGKTTTSSMLKHILEDNGGCNYFIGAGDGYINKNYKTFVMEADEFNKHFLAYHPRSLIITNIEAEHLECYKDLDDIIASFIEVANKTTHHIVACGDNDGNLQLKVNKKIIYYGFNDNNEYIIKNNYLKDNLEYFDLYHNEEFLATFTLPLIGKHMVLNATGAIIMSLNYNIPIAKIKESLTTFHNAARRCAESMIKGTLIIDDYAHHPTEISSTIDGIKRKYPNKRLVVVFKPNTYSRFLHFTDDFVHSLKKADKVYITDIYSDREKQEDYPNITSQMLIDKINGSEKISLTTMDKLQNERDSIICFMSCANVQDMIDKLKEIL